jgi:hypothetical protein
MIISIATAPPPLLLPTLIVVVIIISITAKISTAIKIIMTTATMTIVALV